jgi:hypothetical protein
MSAGGKPVCSHMRILTDSAQKRNRKEVLANYNKTRINTGNQKVIAEWSVLYPGINPNPNPNPNP